VDQIVGHLREDHHVVLTNMGSHDGSKTDEERLPKAWLTVTPGPSRLCHVRRMDCSGLRSVLN